MVDSHCHLDLMNNMKKIAELSQVASFGIFAVGTTPKAYSKDIEICHRHPNIRVGLGMHPQLIGSGYDDIELFSMLAKESRYIGEVGLDFSKEYLGTKEAQLLAFDKVTKLCEKAGNKIISVHSLKSVATVLEIIEKNKMSNTNAYILHWFTGSTTQLKKALDLGCYFSINPRMTSTRSGQELIKLIPTSHILVETDAPFALRYFNINQAKIILKEAVQNISRIKACDIDDVLEKTENRLFG